MLFIFSTCTVNNIFKTKDSTNKSRKDQNAVQICVDGMEDDDDTPIPSPTSTAAAAATSLPPAELAAAARDAHHQRPNNHMIRPITFSVDNILAPGRDEWFLFHT